MVLEVRKRYQGWFVDFWQGNQRLWCHLLRVNTVVRMNTARAVLAMSLSYGSTEVEHTVGYTGLEITGQG